MVPGAHHGIAGEQTLRERAALMRAGTADRVEAIAETRQQHIGVSHLHRFHLAIGKVTNLGYCYLM
jgi:hypothetical protein